MRTLTQPKRHRHAQEIILRFARDLVFELYSIIKIYLADAHRWYLPVLRYREIMVIYSYPFLEVVTLLFSWVIFISDCIYILTGSPG